jgi:hypothetical protein
MKVKRTSEYIARLSVCHIFEKVKKTKKYRQGTKKTKENDV